MTASDFNDFVRRQAAAASHGPDWEARKREWLERLSELYRQVESYLAEFTAQGLIRITRDWIELHEERLGSYQAQQLHIDIGPSAVRLTPIGTLLVGSAGRADLVGRNGTVKIALTDRNVSSPQMQIRIRHAGEPEPPPPPEPDWVWKVIVTRPKLHYVPLSEKTFRDALLEVANG